MTDPSEDAIDSGLIDGVGRDPTLENTIQKMVEYTDDMRADELILMYGEVLGQCLIDLKVLVKQPEDEYEWSKFFTKRVKKKR